MNVLFTLAGLVEVGWRKSTKVEEVGGLLSTPWQARDIRK